VEELLTLSAGRWEIVISKVEPGTVEEQQGAKIAMTVYCDREPFAGYAYAETIRGQGPCGELMPPTPWSTEDSEERIAQEKPDFVSFVISERDLQQFEFLLARVHNLAREWKEKA